MIPVILSKTLAAASANNICTSQSAAGAGNLTLNGSTVTSATLAQPFSAASLTVATATLDTQRRVRITSAGNDSGITFTVYGTREGGIPIQETVTGANASTADTTLDFLTVTRIAVSGATAGNVTVGTNTTGSSAWKMPNYHLTPFIMEIDTSLSGTVTYSIEYTMDDFATPTTPTAKPTARATTVAAATTAQMLSIPSTSNPAVFRGWRLTVSSGTGTVTAEAIQAGIRN